MTVCLFRHKNLRCCKLQSKLQAENRLSFFFFRTKPTTIIFCYCWSYSMDLSPKLIKLYKTALAIDFISQMTFKSVFIKLMSVRVNRWNASEFNTWHFRRWLPNKMMSQCCTRRYTRVGQLVSKGQHSE